MGNMDRTFRVAFNDGSSQRWLDEADSATVALQAVDSSGAVLSGIDLGAGAGSAVTMTQVHPGTFEYTSSGDVLDRGSLYKATYAVTAGSSTTNQTETFTARSEDTAAPRTPPHSYDFAALKAIVRKTLGLGDTADPGTATAGEIANDAIERLWREHRWTFQDADPYYFDFQPNQHRVPLPSDYGELVSLRRPRSTTERFVRVAHERVIQLRESDTAFSNLTYYYSIVSDPSSVGTDRSRYVVDMFPAPAVFEQDAGILHYRRQCPLLVNETDVPPFPSGFASLLKCAVRLAACEQEGHEDLSAEIGRYERLLTMAKRHDGRHVPRDLGFMGDTGAEIDPWHDRAVERRPVQDDYFE